MNIQAAIEPTVSQIDESIVIEARNTNVFYGDKQAIFDVDVDILANTVTAFIGPSGMR